MFPLKPDGSPEKPPKDSDDSSDSDTSKEEDTESEDTEPEDSEEESSDDSSEESDSEESGDEEEDDSIMQQYFTDPSSVPKELRGAFKKLQGIFTKRMQEMSYVKKKAQAFDTLAMDPEFQRFIEERQAGKKPSGKPAKKTDDDNSDDDNAPITRSALRAELARLMQGREVADNLKVEAEQFKKDHPDWELHKEELSEVFTKHPTLSYEEAWTIITGPENKEEMRRRLLKAKKNASVNKPNKVGGKESIKPKKGMSIMDAFNLAKRKAGMK